MEFSDLPGKRIVYSDHLPPKSIWLSRITLSSSTVHVAFSLRCLFLHCFSGRELFGTILFSDLINVGKEVQGSIHTYCHRGIGNVSYRLQSVASMSSTSVESEVPAQIFWLQGFVVKETSLILEKQVVFVVLQRSYQQRSPIVWSEVAREVGSSNVTIQVRTKLVESVLYDPDIDQQRKKQVMPKKEKRKKKKSEW